jgi:glutaredoxin-like protein DUF836
VNAASARLILVTREDCGLCEEFLADLATLASERELPPLELRDVDADPLLLRRYGLHVPVLLLDGEAVCMHRLDRVELNRLLRPR